MNCMWKWKRSSVVKNEPQNSLVLFILRCCINCMESKMDLSHLMIRTFLFLYRFDWTIFVCSLPATDAIPPSLITSRRSPAPSQTSRFAFHTFPDFCPRLESIRILFFSIFNRRYLSYQTQQEDLETRFGQDLDS